LERKHANVGQMTGRPGEVWLSESSTDHLLALPVWRGESKRRLRE
jgi:streptogramin lyase